MRSIAVARKNLKNMVIITLCVKLFNLLFANPLFVLTCEVQVQMKHVPQDVTESRHTARRLAMPVVW